jgi:ketosteroid isomerase-like protein
VERPPDDSVETARSLIAAFNAHAWTRLRALYRDDALLLTVAGGPAPLGPDETVAAMQQAANDIVHSITFGTPEPIDEHAVVVAGTVRSRTWDQRGSTLTRRVWLVTFREGRLYRMRVYGTRDDALRGYREHGVALGM